MYVQPTSFFVSSMSLYHKPLHPNGPSVELVCNKINMHGCWWDRTAKALLPSLVRVTIGLGH
jgi:hypothetical protein